MRTILLFPLVSILSIATSFAIEKMRDRSNGERGATEGSRSAQASVQGDEAERQTNPLRDAIIRMHLESDTPAVLPASTIATPVPRTTTPERTDGEADERIAREALFETLQNRLDTEHVDEGWAFETARLIEAALESVITSDMRIEETQCASTRCRVIVAHPELAAMPQHVIRTLVASGELSDFGINIDYRTGQTSVYVTSREGLFRDSEETTEGIER